MLFQDWASFGGLKNTRCSIDISSSSLTCCCICSWLLDFEIIVWRIHISYHIYWMRDAGAPQFYLLAIINDLHSSLYDRNAKYMQNHSNSILMKKWKLLWSLGRLRMNTNLGGWLLLNIEFSFHKIQASSPVLVSSVKNAQIHPCNIFIKTFVSNNSKIWNIKL